MTRRGMAQPKEEGPPDPLAAIVFDAVESATEAADEAGADIRQIINGEEGLGAVFAAALDAVADTEPRNIGMSVFDAAMRAAMDAVSGSTIPSVYDRVRISVESIPDRLVRAAGQRAASDLFADMAMQDRSVDGERLQDSMRAAAVQAAKTRLERDDATETVQAAAADVRDMAGADYENISRSVMIGAPVHAATVAVFEVAVRGVLPDDLDYAVEEACNDLPEMARRHGDLIVTLVGALSIIIADETEYTQRYQDAVRSAEEISRNEAVDRIAEEISGSTFESVYTALVASAYANSDGSAFESGYEETLAAAFGTDFDRGQQEAADWIASAGPLPGMDTENPDLQMRLTNTIKMLLDYTGDPGRQRLFINAMEADYRAAASSGQIDGLISLYDMAYRAGYEAAGIAAGEKSTGMGHQRR